MSAVEVAREFHESYERLAYETREDTKDFDPRSINGKLMTAVCEEVVRKIERKSFDAGFRAGLRESRK